MTDPRHPVDGAGRIQGARLVGLYPRAWRERYEVEFLAVLSARAPSRADRIDIVRGALDAHLHPDRPSMVPGLAALLGGGLWILGAGPILALPAPTDWPGYLFETLPVALLAVVALSVAVFGAWLRLDGRADRAERRLGAIGVGIGMLGHAAWIGLLVGAIAGIAYGAPLAVASTVAGLGTVLIGVALARAGDWPIAGLLVVAPVLLVIPPSVVPSPISWLAFGGTWLLIGVVQLVAATKPVGPSVGLSAG
jgi:hypothetical protein